MKRILGLIAVVAIVFVIFFVPAFFAHYHKKVVHSPTITAIPTPSQEAFLAEVEKKRSLSDPPSTMDMGHLLVQYVLGGYQPIPPFNGWAITFTFLNVRIGEDKQHNTHLYSSYRATAAKSGYARYTYRIKADSKFEPQMTQYTVDPPVQVHACADGSHPAKGYCSDGSKPQTPIAR